jgi:L-arabinose isomerase
MKAFSGREGEPYPMGEGDGMIHRATERTAVVGLFAVGHGAYWEQFDGLLDRLKAHHAVLKDKLKVFGVEVVDYGIVDTSIAGYAVLEKMRADGPDIVFCNMVTYATSSTFAPIMRDINVPVVLVALQPLEALDYTAANTFMQLENDNICSVPEFTATAARLGKKVSDVIIGRLHGDAAADSELFEWCEVAKALHALKGARIALMGHVLEAMYDMHADPAMVSAAFGIHVPLLEIDDVVRFYERVTEDEINMIEQIICAEFDMPDPKSDPVTEKLTKADLRKAAAAAAALDRVIERYRLNGLAYYYEGSENSVQREVAGSLIVGNSLLNARGFPMCGEYDIKTCIAMLIMDRLDMGGSFAEFHPFDFRDDFILVGHDGPHHIAIAEGKPALRSLKKFHGKPGSGASVEFKIKEGPITMLGITQKADGRFKFVIGEGVSKAGPIPPTGNTNTRGHFMPNTKDFVKAWVMEGPTHHFSLGVGHRARALQKVAGALGIESVTVRP